MSGIMRSRVERRLEPHYARLFAYAVALSRDRDGAQDIFQECIARALDARSVPETEPAFRAWLFAILRNIWIDQSRLRRRRSDLEQEFVTDLVPAPVAPEPCWSMHFRSARRLPASAPSIAKSSRW